MPYDRVKFILGDFYAKVGIENIFKPTIWNERLHQDTNDKGVGMVNLATKNSAYLEHDVPVPKTS